MSQSISSEDRISALPDPIIHHILSFLPTENSAATSILSKRWKPLWLSVPTLRFDDRSFPNYDSFFRFVSSVFLSRDITLPIRSFHLNSLHRSIHGFHDVNRFVYAAAQRGGIENLNLELSIIFRVNLPPSIFSCRTLVVLQLSGLKVNDLSQLVVDFPLLKTLHLRYVRFECFEHCIKLLSGCPILEEFERVWVHENLNETLVLAEDSQCLPNLIRANISHMSSRMASVLFTLLCRAKILCVEPVDYCYSHFPVFQNLIRMELILHSQLHGKWKWVIEVLKRCPKLQNLIIHKKNSTIKDKVVDNWMDPTIIPECLSTHLRTCLLKGYNGTECEIQFAKYIMQNSKVLKTISIKSVSPRGINFKYLMISKLALSARASSTCELVFD